jgi:hypothetical protein
MPPNTVIGLLVILVFVLPGSVYTWAYERQVSAFGVTLSDRVLRFIAVSTIFHLLLAWPEYALYRNAVAGRDEVLPAQFAALWGGMLLLVAVPAGLGTVFGGLYATRSDRSGWRWIRERLPAGAEQRLLAVAMGRTPAPRAWDDLFAERPNAYLLVRVEDNKWIAGRFAAASYAGGFPHATDLYLEEAWEVDQSTGQLGASGLGFPVYIAADTIKWIEVLNEQGNGQEGDDDE